VRIAEHTGAEAEAQGRRAYEEAARPAKPRRWSRSMDPATIPDEVLALEAVRRFDRMPAAMRREVRGTCGGSWSVKERMARS
jgi:hypothetical protein